MPNTEGKDSEVYGFPNAKYRCKTMKFLAVPCAKYWVIVQNNVVTLKYRVLSSIKPRCRSLEPKDCQMPNKPKNNIKLQGGAKYQPGK